MYGHELCNHLLCNLCLYNKTKITVTLLQKLFLLFWNGFELSSSQDKYQIRQRIKGEESKLQEGQVDVTAKFSTSLNSSINRDEDLENIYTSRHTSKGQYSVQKRRNKHQQLREFFQLIYLRIPKCLEKQSLFCFVLYCEYL